MPSHHHKPTHAHQPEPPEPPRAAAGGKELERIIFFSDAVFAIAITLLALDLRLPELPASAPADALLSALVLLTPKFVAYLVSFLVIGSSWVTHHRHFRHIRHYDNGLIWINLGLLLCIGLLPFTTAVMGAHVTSPVGLILYAVSVAITGLLQWLLWWHAVRKHLIAPDVSPRLISHYRWRGIVAPVVFMLSVPIALVIPTVAPLSWSLAAVFAALVNRLRPASDG
jgi:uncharacterized membrane protein